MEARNDLQETPLHFASSWGNIKIVQLLLERNLNIDASNVYGKTPLMTAIRHRHEEVVEQLILSGAVLEARSNDQQTPLHIASSWGNIKILQLILEKNPNLLQAKMKMEIYLLT